MGMRHVGGYRRLRDVGMSNLDIVAVCDIDEGKAANAAQRVEEWFGRRPAVHRTVDEVLRDENVQALDIATIPSAHQDVAVPALRAGRHVISEKPLGLTIRACQAMIDAAAEGGAILATAENLRRDPSLRVARALIDAGLLDTIYLMVHNTVGGTDASAGDWRHSKLKGAIGLDMAVHYTDIVQYLMGDFEAMYGRGLITEPRRRRAPAPDASPSDPPSWIIPTGEDSVIGLYRMTSGAMTQLAYLIAGPAMLNQNESYYDERRVHGRTGAIELPPHRSGRPVVFRTHDEVLTGEEILRILPEFSLDEVTSRFFEPGLITHQLERMEIDAVHLAIELWDFGDAILNHRPPEVDGHLGMTAVAAILGVYESALLGRSVTMQEVMSAAVTGYQDEIDQDLGLLAS
jgi:predicted dehydrogenase